MRLEDFFNLVDGNIPTVRIIDAELFAQLSKESKAHYQRPDGAVLECSYLDHTVFREINFGKWFDCEVVHFCCVHEIHHKDYERLGLIPPFRPDLTCEYEFKDLKQKTYYDIYVDTSRARDK